MPVISIADVPLYLQGGDFYKTLNTDSADDVFEVPDDALKSDTGVNDSAQLEHLLKSMRYWLVSILPKSVFTYILGQPHSECIQIILEYSGTFPVLAATEEIRRSTNDNQKMRVAVTCGSLEQITYLFESIPWTGSNMCDVAANGGNVAALEYFRSKGHDISISTFIAAAAGNNLAVLRYLHEINCPWSVDVCARASYYGHFDALKFLHENGCPWDSMTMEFAALKGNLDCLIFAHTNSCQWCENPTRTAARWGHLDCLKYLHENGFVWDAVACCDAASNGHLDCLQYLHENGCLWDANTPALAAAGGHLNCLQYAHEQGCAWTEFTCYCAAAYKHLRCLQYAHQRGCPIDRTTFRDARSLNPTGECIEYLKMNLQLKHGDVCSK